MIINESAKKTNPFKKVDLGNVFLLITVVGLALFGLVMIYSASSYSALNNYNDSFYFVKKQAIGLVLGLIALVGFSFFDYCKFKKLGWAALLISVVLLLVVFIPGIGKNANGANRWITLGPISVQSSEIAKFGFVIFAATYMAKNYKKMNTFLGMLPVLLAGGGLCFLILLEPNLSVTMCLGMVMLLMLVIGGINLKHFGLLLIPVSLLVPALIIAAPYRLDRLTAFLNPWQNSLDEGYQLIQSLYSLGSGGLFGVGLFNSRQKYLFLPFSESDFIFSIIGEELGFFGCICLCLVYIIIIVQGVKIALRAADRLGCYLAFGIVSVISIQMLINIAVVTGSIPPTGIPLPFISAGGTSLIVFLGAIGILLNISKHKNFKYEIIHNAVVKNKSALVKTKKHSNNI